MNPYSKINPQCKYGGYDMTKKAAYTLTNSEDIEEPWYYIYQNRKILLYVDQNGPVKIQHQPPSGILIAKRELGEKYSKLITWVKCDSVNNGIPFSNFRFPNLELTATPPKYTVNWNPTYATYTVSYPEMDVITTVFVPHDKATVCIKTTVKNKTDKAIDVTVVPSMYPYINKPQMVAWDLPEWYLSGGSLLNGNALTLRGKMSDPDMIEANERSVTYNLDYDEDGEYELSMTKYTGSGCFFAPKSVIEDLSFTHKMKDADKAPGYGSYTLVFAAKYKIKLNPKEEKTFTQALTVQESTSFNRTENEYEKCYFSDESYSKKLKETEEFYEKLFTLRTVKTENPYYDNFINNFAPLQMYWVGSLDRGWPSSMRGSRDASQDFTGIVPLYPEWARSVIIDLFFHQRTDGWMPRQVSTISREAPHDMRYFADGGAFLLELINEYLTFTRDVSLLEEKVKWLNSDKESTVLEHIFTTISYYLDDKNIGEHGLSKIWYGDWWDTMDKIGMEGRGESVTITAQNVLNLKNLCMMLDWLASCDKKYSKYLSLKEKYLSAREGFIKAIKEHAYNKMGFFNAYFNDNGKWILSDCDPDGRARMFIVSNAWALIGECADEEMIKTTLENIEKRSAFEDGYATISTPFYDYIDKAGRSGLGGSTRVDTYNHAQSFLVRAACAVGRPDIAYNATRYILPIEEDYAPVEKTLAPPFSIANKYSSSLANPRRIQLQYLSGTVSYVLRTVYNFFIGAYYGYTGLTIKPCMPKEFGRMSAAFSYLGNKFNIEFIPTDGEKRITVNSVEKGSTEAFISDSEMKEKNYIIIEY